MSPGRSTSDGPRFSRNARMETASNMNPLEHATKEERPERDAVGKGFRVLIGGGGVASLEAVLALAEHRGSGIEVELVCPEREFTLRPLSVAQPFGDVPQRSLDLASFCSEHGVELRSNRIAEIWGGQQRVLLDSGEDVYYDALLLAFGAQPHDVLPGARAFRGAADAAWFAELLTELESGDVHEVVFAVPTGIRWSLPLYELALMTAHWLDERGVGNVELTVVTHEEAPLSVFASGPENRVAELLKQAGIGLVTGNPPVSFTNGLVLEDGHTVAAERVVTLPGLRVPDIPGLPGRSRGYIATDAEMRVDGLRRVWAAGDATWFPIKQGGLAAQQADVAAASIAAAAGVSVEVPAFAPVIRASLLTGKGAEYMRAELGGAGPETAVSPLWWPPAKVAGKRLAPYLARLWSGDPGDSLLPLEDFDPPSDETRASAEEEHRAAVDLALSCARVEAREGDPAQALRWLDVAEKLNVTLPPEYAERRREWERLATDTGAGS